MNKAKDKKALWEKRKEILNNSPYWKLIKMELIEFFKNGCIVRMYCGNDHLNMHNTVHGGAIASLADSACGLSLISVLNEDEVTVTGTLVVNYLKPATGTLTGKGRIIHKGSRSALLEADIFDETGAMVAHAQTTHTIKQTGVPG